MKRQISLGLVLMLSLAAVAWYAGAQEQQPTKATLPPQELTKQAGKQGQPAKAGAPEPFTTKEGKKGWRITIPGNRPLATPAITDGKVLVGGGFGSHEFYAFDAKTGTTLWIYQTGDDGPTAAAVEDGYIAFNTESCELEIITMDGKRVWKKWLGDPLMSMPAINKGKVYMAYPDSKNNNQHHITCFDVKTGKELWKQPIAGDIITAPVIDKDKVYLASVEGTMYCFEKDAGKLVWSEKKNATSSPMVWNDRCYFSRREAVTVKDKNGKDIKQQMEAVAGRPVAAAGKVSVIAATSRPADYLDFHKRVDASGVEKANKGADATVGFATAPQAAKLMLAESNLGQGSVAGVWSYQGSRPFVYKGRMFTVMGDALKCLDPQNEKVLWQKELRKDKGAVDATVTPPALVNGKIFVGTAKGEVICLAAQDGTELWRATVGDPVVFQPAVANGCVYVATSNGKLYCLETGDQGDHGWLMWGANAAHNGKVE